MKNHGKSDSSWKRWDVDENADVVISILRSTRHREMQYSWMVNGKCGST